MKAVVELPLKTPLELRVVQIAGMHVEIVSVHRNRRVPELDDEFDAFSLGAGGKVQQWMFVEAKLGLDAVKAGAGGIGHAPILPESDLAKSAC